MIHQAINIFQIIFANPFATNNVLSMSRWHIFNWLQSIDWNRVEQKKKNEWNERRHEKNTFHMRIFSIWSWKRCQLLIEHCSCIQCILEYYTLFHLKKKKLIWKCHFEYIMSNGASSGLNWQCSWKLVIWTREFQNEPNDTLFFFRKKKRNYFDSPINDWLFINRCFYFSALNQLRKKIHLNWNSIVRNYSSNWLLLTIHRFPFYLFKIEICCAPIRLIILKLGGSKYKITNGRESIYDFLSHTAMRIMRICPKVWLSG